MNEDMVHNPQRPTPQIPVWYRLLNAVNYMSQSLVREKTNKVTRSGITKNKSQGTSKSRRKMQKESRRRNRK